MEYAIETFNLTKKFIQTKGFLDIFRHPFRKKEILALDRVNLKIKKGELFGILGPNGAGKTTLIKLLCTLILPTSGNAYINGYNIVEEEEKVKAEIGLITGEERSFYWRLTGRQNLEFFASLQGFSFSKAREKVNEVLNLVGLEDKADDKFQNYSTGMKQKMAIARGLINNPEILFMDEPTKSLDPSASQNLREFVKEKLIKEQGKTVFLSTHHLEEAEQLCDRIAIINKNIKASGTLKELRKIIGNQEKYVIEVKNLPNSVLENLRSLDGVINLSNTPIYDKVISLEILLSNSKTVLPQVIEIIVCKGGKIMACHNKEIVLEEIFARITKNGGI
ncbi:MAG: ABC transporter ATP-binding protein [Methanosarcinales archaeon]